MDHIKWGERFMDETVRLDEVIYLAGSLSEIDALADVFVEKFVEYLDPDEVREVFPDMPEYTYRSLGEAERGYVEEFAEWLVMARKWGFLVHFETPVMTPDANGCSTFSWGRYTTRWFYGETLEEAFEKGFAWVAERRAEERKKAGLE